MTEKGSGDRSSSKCSKGGESEFLEADPQNVSDRNHTIERWIGLQRRAVAPRLKLLAIPYAGGGSSAFRYWPADLAYREWLEFTVLQLPGRERRSSEPAYTNMVILLDDLERDLVGMLDMPFVLFGYSLGAAIAYELALRLAARGFAPNHLIVAARAPTYCARPRSGIVQSGRDDVIAKVRRLGGTAANVIDSPHFDKHFLPVIQADFSVADTFHRAVAQILPCPVLALAATDDPEIKVEDVRAWEIAGGEGFEIALFEGGHFFLHSSHLEVITLINNVCRSSASMADGPFGVTTAMGRLAVDLRDNRALP
jgi:surfactin synthase thioesterase subunit